MKTTIVLFTLFGLFTIISCGPTNQDAKQTQNDSLQTTMMDQSPMASTDPTQPTNKNTSEQGSAGQNNSEVMLNPPHGEPFHRCDLAIGAPLNTPPAQANVNQNVNTAPPSPKGLTVPKIENTMQQNPPQTQNTKPANGNKPKLNPPHGEPYHRCEIPVGDPLP
jgi:hypothetical protein